MKKLWKSFRLIVPVVVVLLFVALASPVHSSRLDNHLPDTCQKTCFNKPSCTAKVTAKANHKSVLDAEALESPISFFKDMMSSGAEDDDNDTASSSAVPMLMALKGLIATLLSTII